MVGFCSDSVLYDLEVIKGGCLKSKHNKDENVRNSRSHAYFGALVVTCCDEKGSKDLGYFPLAEKIHTSFYLLLLVTLPRFQPKDRKLLNGPPRMLSQAIARRDVGGI